MKVKELAKNKGVPEQCVRCDKASSLTVDHKIPRAVMRFFGLESIEDDIRNLQILCQTCNSEKGQMLELDNPEIDNIVISLLQVAKKYHKMRVESMDWFDKL